MSKEFLTVSALTQYIKLKFDKDRYLKNIPLKAEIAEINYRRGNYYIRLKDEYALISGVIFSQYETEIIKQLEVGAEVVVIGDISVYEKTGSYQIYVREVELYGKGNLYATFEKLKKKLLEKGYFKNEHKKAIPTFPQKAILITAPNSAALHDMLITTKNRFPLLAIEILPAAVQGVKASKELIKQLKKADTLRADVIVLARGGGSYEDLQAFNDEELALQIFQTNTPIVTGIGHEIDVTIADLVADLRAATPTAAIEQITPDKNELLAKMNTYSSRLVQSFRRMLQIQKQYINDQQKRLTGKSPEVILRNEHLQVQQAWQRMHSQYIKAKIIDERKQLVIAQRQVLLETVHQKLLDNRKMLKQKSAILEALSPFDVLIRGYAIIQKNNTLVASVDEVIVDDTVDILLKDGTLVCDVKEIKNDKENAII